jgi:hypothetical protein
MCDECSFSECFLCLFMDVVNVQVGYICRFLAQGKNQGSMLTTHRQALTTGPFDNTCRADAVSPKVAIGGLQDIGVYNQGKFKVYPRKQQTTI